MRSSDNKYVPTAYFSTPEEKEIVESFSKKKFSRLRQKIDFHILPACLLLYFFGFLDRVNIGNAEIAGMDKTIGISSLQYSIIVTVFFVPYIVFEAPSNILLKKITPKIFLPLATFLFGICNMCMGFARNCGDLIALRVFLGLFESGVLPGCSYYLSNWYGINEVSYRISLGASAAIISGAFSGILAYAIMEMNGVGHLAGWRWIFILEGLATIVISIICYFFIHNNPRTCNFLKENEVVYWEWHLQQDIGKGCAEVDNEALKWKHIKRGMLNWRVLYMGILTLGCTVPSYSFSYFLPFIIKNLGFKAKKAELLSVPPYIFACIVTVICSYYSDKCKNRYVFIIAPMVVTIIGFGMVLGQNEAAVSYIGIFLACTGPFASFPPILSWNANNYPNVHVRGIAMGIHIGFSNIGGIIASFIYKKQDSPKFIIGHSVCLAFVLLTIVMTLILVLYYKWRNKKKNLYCEDHLEDFRDQASSDLAKLDEENPFFRYQL